MSPRDHNVVVSSDPSRCRHCGACEAICPNRVFRFEGDRIATVFPSRCIQCGHCVAVCPEGALANSAMSKDRFEKTDPALLMSPESLLRRFSARRSCRKFKDAPVPEDMIRKLIDTAMFAPTATNSQNVRFVLVDKESDINSLEQKVARYYLKLEKQLENPLTRLAIRLAVGSKPVDTYRYHLPAIADMFRSVLAGKERLFHGAKALVIAYASGLPYIASANCNLAVMEILLAADAMGLGACYNGYLLTAMMRDKRLRRNAGVPDGYTPGAAIAVGFPDVTFHFSPPRRRPRITGIGELD